MVARISGERRTIGQGDLDQADALARTEAAFDALEGAEFPLLPIQGQVDNELILAGFEERFDRLDAAVKRDANDELDLLVVEHGVEAGAGVAAIAEEKDAFLQFFAGEQEFELAAIEEAPIGIVGELIEDVVEQDHAKLRRSVGDAVVELAFLLGDAGAVSSTSIRSTRSWSAAASPSRDTPTTATSTSTPRQKRSSSTRRSPNGSRPG